VTIVEEITPVELGIDENRFPGWRPIEAPTDVKTCDVCGKEIPNTGYSKARYLAQRFCSHECYADSLKGKRTAARVELECDYCKVTFERRRVQMRNSDASEKKRNFCSDACMRSYFSEIGRDDNENLMWREFGSFVVVGGPMRKRSPCGTVYSIWTCLCVCGSKREVSTGALKQKRRISCGCAVRTSNGESAKTPEWKSWISMIKRCASMEEPTRSWYADRGITVCKRWRESYLAFLSDMGRKPTPAHTLERKNNDLGYFKENCKWATPTEQARNRRTTVWITFSERTMSLAAWAEESGVHPETLQGRLRRGCPMAEALIPIRRMVSV
jgi:hypothetical protein